MADLRTRTCCFTGHRVIPDKELPGVMERTEQFVRELLKQGVTYFGVGGAIGYDTEAAKLLFRLRETDYPHIKVILVYPFEGFTNRWTGEQRAVYARLRPKYNKAVCIAPAPGREAYLARNVHLVDGSAYCICYCTRVSGGTAYTVRYAKKKGLWVRNVGEYDIGCV